MEQVILVDKQDNKIGLLEKLDAHKKGLLHRAVSVFIFNSKQEMLIQRRALTKYHSPGLWSNTACTHPKDKEKVNSAASRRLIEEMGISAKINFAFKFIYRAKLDKDLIEHELDHVFIGISNHKPNYNTNEVCDFRYISKKELDLEIKNNPLQFSEWFKLCYERVYLSATNSFNTKKNSFVNAY